eukprot:gene42568-52014_t
MAGWFELKKYGNGEYRFRLKTREAQRDGTFGAVPAEERYERRMATGGKNYFRLKAGREVILESHLYDSEPTLDAAIERIMTLGTTPKVELA